MTTMENTVPQSSTPTVRPWAWAPGRPVPRWAWMVVTAGVAVSAPSALGRAGILTDYGALLIGTAVCYAAAGLSLNLLMGYAGQISLGHFSLLGVGAFTSGILTGPYRLGLPFVVSIPLSALAGAAVALLIGLPALRLKGLYLAIVTVGFAYAMTESVFRLDWVSRGSAGAELPRPIINDFFFNRNVDYLGVLLLLLVGIWIIDANVTTSKVGRAFHALRSDEAMAASFGVDVTRYKLLAFALSGAIAGVAGMMLGHLSGTVTSESFPYQNSLLLVVIVVVGGLGSRVGVLVSAGFYAVFPIVMPKVFGEGIRLWDLMIGAVLLMFTVARNPGGLAGAFHENKEKKHAKAARQGDGDDGTEPAMPKLPNLPRPSGLPARAEASAGSIVLEASDISVNFGGLRALTDASLRVPQGKIVGLIGPNGAGKTTLFNAISGLIRPSSGRVHLLGQDVTDLPAHARARLGMGRTFQLIGLAKDLSVTENLLLAQHVVAGYPIASALSRIGAAGRVEHELRTRAHDAITALGFDEYADTPVKRLSHGQQRIVEIGSCLVTAPELVMLDEPSAGMSPGATENLAVRLRDLRDELGRTVLLIEHNIPLVLDVCDELYVLSSGEMLAHGAPDEVVGRPDVIEAYLGVTA